MSNLSKYDDLNEERQTQADAIILRRTLHAAGTGLIPIPIVDAAALLGVQMYMVRDIAIIYEKEFKEQRVKSLIGALASDVAAVSLFKFIPGLGTFFGGAAASAIGASVTYALGKVFVQHFEKGGTFLNFDPVASEKYFKEKIEEGKKVVRNLRKKEEAKPTQKSNKEEVFNESQLSAQNKELSQEVLSLKKEIEALKQQRKVKREEQNQVKETEQENNIDLENLQFIKGIGSKTAEVLTEAGIKNIKDLSKATPEELKIILEKAKGNFSLIFPDTWTLQAQLVVKGNFDTLKKFQEKLSKEH